MAGFPDGIFKAFIRFQQTLGCFYFQWFQTALGINLRPLFSWDQQLNDQPPPPRRVMMQVNRSETWFRKVYIVDSYIGPLEGKTIGVGDLWQPTSNTMFWIFMNIYKQLSIVFFLLLIYIYIYIHLFFFRTLRRPSAYSPRPPHRARLCRFRGSLVCT